jgi:hypothetical protein
MTKRAHALSLTRETVRHLTSDDLARVAGGLTNDGDLCRTDVTQAAADAIGAAVSIATIAVSLFGQTVTIVTTTVSAPPDSEIC